MKNKTILDEAKMKKCSEKEREKQKTKFTITIVDNETKQVLMKEDTNVVMGVVSMPSKSNNSIGCVQQFCSTACDGHTMKHLLETLEKLQCDVMLQMLKAAIGGDNE